MNDKRVPILDEEPKYKKKSKGNCAPRSKHKHIYETVLLHIHYRFIDYKTGKEHVKVFMKPTKVCTICGRVGHVDQDPSYYINTPVNNTLFEYYTKDLTQKALDLPGWYITDALDKFAVKMQD